MDKKKIIQSVKRQDEEKIGFSLKMPVSMKGGLQDISEKDSISMNALIVATLQSFIDDDCGNELRYAKKLLVEANDYIESNIPDDQEMHEMMMSCTAEEEYSGYVKGIENRKDLYRNISNFLKKD